MKAWFLNIDGSVQPFANNGTLDFEKVNRALGIKDGGIVERVHVLFEGNRCDMLVDEDGVAKNLPINARASLVYWTATHDGRTGAKFDPLHGPLIHGRAILYEGEVWK